MPLTTKKNRKKNIPVVYMYTQIFIKQRNTARSRWWHMNYSVPLGKKEKSQGFEVRSEPEKRTSVNMDLTRGALLVWNLIF